MFDVIIGLLVRKMSASRYTGLSIFHSLHMTVSSHGTCLSLWHHSLPDWPLEAENATLQTFVTDVTHSLNTTYVRATYLISMLLKSKRERVRSGHNVIYCFLTLLQICCWHSEEKWEQLFFGDKIPHLESVFWQLGCVPVLWSLIRILQASLVTDGLSTYGSPFTPEFRDPFHDSAKLTYCPLWGWYSTIGIRHVAKHFCGVYLNWCFSDFSCLAVVDLRRDMVVVLLVLITLCCR